jgi:hypothetical protein
MYVNNVDDFLDHTRSHVENLEYLAVYAMSKVKESKKLRESLGIPNDANLEEFSIKVIEGISYHDATKLNKDSPVKIGKNLEARLAKEMSKDIVDINARVLLAKKLIKRGFSAPEILYSGYAGGLTSMDGNTSKEFFSFIDNHLNTMDDEVIKRYMDSSFENEWERKAFKKIEDIVDKIDRGMNPISSEEFGRKMSPASDFVGDVDIVLKDLIIDCENNYDKICPKRFYHKRIDEMSVDSPRLREKNGKIEIEELSTEMYDDTMSSRKPKKSSPERTKGLDDFILKGRKPW